MQVEEHLFDIIRRTPTNFRVVQSGNHNAPTNYRVVQFGAANCAFIKRLTSFLSPTVGRLQSGDKFSSNSADYKCAIRKRPTGFRVIQSRKRVCNHRTDEFPSQAVGGKLECNHNVPMSFRVVPSEK